MRSNGLHVPGLLQRTTRIALAALLVLSHPLWAATIIVDETACTLVDAITAANDDIATGGCLAGSGADTIVLTTNVTLTEVNNRDNGLPLVTSEIKLEGGGFTIERRTDAPPFRLFSVASSGTLTVNDAILRHGEADSGGSAVYNLGTTTLSHSIVVGNYSDYFSAAAVCNQAGTLTLDNCTVANNAGRALLAEGGIVTLTGTTVTANSSGIVNVGMLYMVGGAVLDNQGDGVRIGGYPYVAFISNSTISGNGVGLRLVGHSETHVTHSAISSNLLGVEVDSATAYLTNSTVTGNEHHGIEVYYFGSAHLLNSTVSGNDNSGIDVTYYGTVHLMNSTVADNGGTGLWVHLGTEAHLTNSTVSGNAVGIGNYGSSDVHLKSSTVVGHAGAGLRRVPHSGYFGLNDSIIANNSGGDCVGPGLFQGQGNFDGDGSCSDSEPITGLDPALADNGGPTRTHALLTGSSAIDAVGDCGLATDQRGRARNDGACDSGSYEFQCDIVVRQGVEGTLIDFTPAASPFDVVAGSLSELLDDNDFSRAVCLGTFPASPAVDTLPEPPVGDGRYYLARGLTNCVGAGYGDSFLTPDPRDALDLGPCPRYGAARGHTPSCFGDSESERASLPKL